jgi:CxxC motif-containing protein (DUF1111 family)
MKSGIMVLALVLLVGSAEAQTTRRRVSPQPTPPPAAAPAPGEPLAGLTAAQLIAFDEGKGDFTEEESLADGLGPVFNERSCATCHLAPAIGGGSRRMVTRFGRRLADGTFDPLANLGGSLVQDHAIRIRDGSTHDFRPERPPAEANVVTPRRSPPLLGLGLVDATPDSDFVALAAMQSARHDGTAGRAPLVDNLSAGMKTVGKFGWKGQVPTLFQFAGDAYLNELGITNPLFPNESCPQGNCAELAFNPAPGLNDTGAGLTKLHDFMTLLAPPARGPQNRDTSDGENTFNQLGCDSCHTATFRSGSSPIAALNRQTYHPYGDFLLHDMGALGDGIEQGAANGREIRTPPLWGLRFIETYLHDGRARTLDEAILAHDGQARASRDRFTALDAAAKAKLMAFLRSL